MNDSASERTTVTREEAIWAIGQGLTPRYVEQAKAQARETGGRLTHLYPLEEARWIQALAIHWGLTEANSYE